MRGVTVASADHATFDKDGKRVPVERNPLCKATQTTPRYDLIADPKEPLAIDIEFQTCREWEVANFRERMGRIAVVNTRGDVVYDTFVYYKDEGNLRVRVNEAFGVTWDDLRRDHGAKSSREAEAELGKMMSGRIIVGHGMRNDLRALGPTLVEKPAEFVDTQTRYGRTALGTLVHQYLNYPSFNAHDPTCDAKATMMLYLRNQPYGYSYSVKDFPKLGS